jgi:hypothetical protein
MTLALQGSMEIKRSATALSALFDHLCEHHAVSAIRSTANQAQVRPDFGPAF